VNFLFFPPLKAAETSAVKQRLLYEVLKQETKKAS